MWGHFSLFVTIIWFCDLDLVQSVDPQCSRRCTMADTDTDCWRESVDFFTQQVQKSLRDYAALMTHMHHWRANLPEDVKQTMPGTLNQLEELSIDRVLQQFSQLDEKHKAPLTKDDLQSIFNILLNKTLSHMDEYSHPEVVPPSVTCPVPCDYYPDIWVNLTFVLIACLVLCCLTFFLHTCYTSRRLDRLGKL